MRRFSSTLVSAFSVFLCVGSASAVAPDFELTEVSPSVVMASHSHGANITCIALDDGLVFVDASLSTEIAAGFRETMEQRFERKTQALILTHAHFDHIFGMAAFVDVQVIAAKAARPLFERQLAIEFDEQRTAAYANIFPTFAEDIGNAKPFLPTVWVEGEFALGSGKDRLVFRNTGGHTTGSSFVYFEPEGVLVTGDLVQVERYPYFGDPSNDLELWISTLKMWHSMEVAKICPGHGRVVGSEYLPPIWGYFEALVVTLTELKAAGSPIEEVVVHPSLPAGYWDETEAEPRWWKMCIARVYQSF